VLFFNNNDPKEYQGGGLNAEKTIRIANSKGAMGS
jgi:hypothetical protein